MKKIFKLMNEYNIYNSRNRYAHLRLFQDMSGQFVTGEGIEIFGFVSKRDLIEQLTAKVNNVKEEIQNI